MRKDEKLGAIAFFLFVLLFTLVSLWFTYPPNTAPSILVVSIGTILALFIGFLLWANSANEEKKSTIEALQEELRELKKQTETTQGIS